MIAQPLGQSISTCSGQGQEKGRAPLQQLAQPLDLAGQPLLQAATVLLW